MSRITRSIAMMLAVFGLGTAQAGLISGQYIVILDTDALTQPVEQTAQTLVGSVGGGELLHVYDTALTGFAVKLPAVAAQALAILPLVQDVEQDRNMYLVETQFDPPWGLDRSDQRELPLDNSYSFPAGAGADTHVYIIDTGLRATHIDFAGRVGEGRNFGPGEGSGLGGLLCQLLGIGCPPGDPEDTTDCNGHGTHVAGSAAGTEHGIAKNAMVYPVRVFGCGGTTSTSNIIAGIDWVAANRQLPAVANLSLGGGTSNALDDAVRGMIAQGVTAVIAAGNDNANACNTSPARVEEAITVGSTTIADARSSFSNFGPCVDIFAPGSNIPSAWHTSDTATNSISGTSMAAPHVAGGAARHLAADPNATPAQVMDAIIDTATTGAVGNPGSGSPNRLLYLDPAGP